MNALKASVQAKDAITMQLRLTDLARYGLIMIFLLGSRAGGSPVPNEALQATAKSGQRLSARVVRRAQGWYRCLGGEDRQ